MELNRLDAKEAGWNNMEESIAILGAGIAGIAAAYRLKELEIEDAIIYEQEDTYGGLCNSFEIDGFTFDTFGHISFDPATTKWLEEKTKHFVHEPEALNYDRGRWLRHPVQNNLIGLPVEERIELIKGFVERKNVEDICNYGQWLKNIYGTAFSERYPYQYTRKYWTVEPEQLEPKWVKGRMYEPTLEEVLRGAMTAKTPGVHYSKKANYPLRGGFKAFLRPMAEHCKIRYNKRVYAIDIKGKKITFRDGSSIFYDKIITTIPLPELCGCIEGIPTELQEASKKLDYTTGVLVSLGLKRRKASPALWFYIYDEDILPARVYAPDWKSPYNVPKNCSALQAEIYFSTYRPMSMSQEKLLDDTIKQLLKLELFNQEDIVVKDIRVKKYANIMFTPAIYEAREKIHRFLDENEIDYAGRFGEWDYLWAGQSLLSGRTAADKCIKR